MKCAKCGAEIRPGCVYCSNCGQEAQIVTEINILEDDLLRSMLEEEEKSGSQTETLVSIEKTAEKTDQKPHGTKTASDSSKKKKKRMLEKKRKKARKTLVILVVLLIAALAVAFGVMQYNHSNSVSYQLKKATEALDQKNYTSALQYAEYVLQLDSENEDALVLEGQIYVLMKQVEEKMYMKVTSVYGLTEAAPGMTATRIDDSFDVRCNTVGRDFEFTEVRVIDPETGEECPVGVQGEMCNRGYNTMKGYYKNPEATAEVIDKDNFLHSGDLGIKDEDGNYRITGRIKDMIIRGGENIYPREIEEFLYKLDGVKDVQVAGIPSKKYGEAVGAFIILQEGVEMHESDVRDFCKNKISRYKIPKYVFFVKEFPMTGSGKIQKFRLKDLGLQLCKEQGIEII